MRLFLGRYHFLRICIGNWRKIRNPKQSHIAIQHNIDPVSTLSEASLTKWPTPCPETLGRMGTSYWDRK